MAWHRGRRCIAHTVQQTIHVRTVYGVCLFELVHMLRGQLWPLFYGMQWSYNCVVTFQFKDFGTLCLIPGFKPFYFRTPFQKLERVEALKGIALGSGAMMMGRRLEAISP